MGGPAEAVQSIDLIRDNLKKSRDRVLARAEEMREHAVVFPTQNGGCHTLWVLGHLAYIETLVIRSFMLGEANPLADWEEIFDGTDVSGDISRYPPFDEVLSKCREARESTLALLDSLSEGDLDKRSAKAPIGFEDAFGTMRLCVQYVADHWYMHRGQLADARRAAGLGRMWL
jgi:DinB family protein